MTVVIGCDGESGAERGSSGQRWIRTARRHPMDCRAEPWRRVAIRRWERVAYWVRVGCERIEEDEEKKIRWREI
jgi:hypothetical protein